MTPTAKHLFYYSPGTCSLAPHIVPEEIGEPYELKPISASGPREGEMTSKPERQRKSTDRPAELFRCHDLVQPLSRNHAGDGVGRRRLVWRSSASGQPRSAKIVARTVLNGLDRDWCNDEQ